jgi:hypothetical protein
MANIIVVLFLRLVFAIKEVGDNCPTRVFGIAFGCFLMSPNDFAN